MKCIIPANHAKIFAKAIHCLAKLGTEVYLDCTEDELEMKTVNASRSTFACFVFPKSFFTEYQSLPIYEEENELLKCKISVKTFLQVFRSITFIERSVETCEIALSSDNCHLVFTLKCKHAIVKTYQLNFQECESLKAVFTKDLCPNKLTSSCKLLMDVLLNFPSTLEEISLAVSPCKVSLSNFSEESEMGKTMSTEISLHPEEFEYFQIGIDTNISFSLKDLRAILGFAESCNSEFKMNFEYGGKPLVLSLGHDDVLSANFVLATICEETHTSTRSVEINSISSSNIRDRKRQTNITDQTPVEKRIKHTNGTEVNCDETSFQHIDLTRDGSTINVRSASNIDTPVRHKGSIHNHTVETHHMHVKEVFFGMEHGERINDNTILAPDSDEET